MSVSLLLYGLVVTALVLAEWREDRRGQLFFKPLAALGFLILALQAGALDSLYGQVVFVGLIACALGDVLLLSRRSQLLFLLGMGAFALGHLAYLSAFMTVQAPLDATKLMIVSIVTIFGGAGFIAWLMPKLDKAMRVPVSLYSVLILIMVIRSFGLPWEGALRIVPAAAVMFALSDMFVARDRFVAKAPLNALMITPFYFGAQALFALSTQI